MMPKKKDRNSQKKKKENSSCRIRFFSSFIRVAPPPSFLSNKRRKKENSERFLSRIFSFAFVNTKLIYSLFSYQQNTEIMRTFRRKRLSRGVSRRRRRQQLRQRTKRRQSGGLIPNRIRRMFSSKLLDKNKFFDQKVNLDEMKAINKPREYGILIRALRLVRGCFWRGYGIFHNVFRKNVLDDCRLLNKIYLSDSTIEVIKNKDGSLMNGEIFENISQKLALILSMETDKTKKTKIKEKILQEIPIFIPDIDASTYVETKFQEYISRLSNINMSNELTNNNKLDFQNIDKFFHKSKNDLQHYFNQPQATNDNSTNESHQEDSQL